MKYNFNKYRYLFSVNNNDKRSDFFIFIIFDLLYRNKELNSISLYQSPFAYNIRNNIEWITYCMDLAHKDTIIDFNPSDFIYFEQIIKTFFIVINTTTLLRKKDKIINFTTIIPPIMYNKSNNNHFNFSEKYFKDIMREMLENIPPFEQIDIVINPVEKCLEKKQLKCLDHLEKCINGIDINDCIKYMQTENYSEEIKKEVTNMEICIAVDTLVKFGFLQNDRMETYDVWEKRILTKLKIKKINLQLKEYILLLLQRINPILEIKNLLKNKNTGISNILIKYKKIYPNYASLIDSYILLENKYFISSYILDCYYNLLKIYRNSSNKKFFNYDNMIQYNDYHNIIENKYKKEQSKILTILEKN